MSNSAISQELPPLMDLAKLKLEVTNTELVDQISSSRGKLWAKGGKKFVVVTLKGKIAEACRIAIDPKDLTAVYEIQTNEGKRLRTTRSFAVALDDVWVISEHAIATSISGGILIIDEILAMQFEKPGTIILKAAFRFPEKLNNFFIRYPTLAKGKAMILKHSK